MIITGQTKFSLLVQTRPPTMKSPQGCRSNCRTCLRESLTRRSRNINGKRTFSDHKRNRSCPMFWGVSYNEVYLAIMAKALRSGFELFTVMFLTISFCCNMTLCCWVIYLPGDPASYPRRTEFSALLSAMISTF
jgi:hypothetical protein